MMRFPRMLLSSMILVIGLITGAYMLLFNFNAKDQEEYAALMKRTDPSYRQESSSYSTQQQHQKVHKQVWLTKDNQRLEMRLHSKHSELVLDHQGDQTNIIEHMHHVACFMQEELYYLLPDGREATLQKNNQLLIRNSKPEEAASWLPLDLKTVKPMQMIRYLEAEKASHHYHTDLVIAENVKVFRYNLPGHDLIESTKNLHPLLTGTAQSAQFSFAGNDPNFVAHGFKATLRNSKSSHRGSSL